jgi:ElaB/YqjD/DUF883 family membrane-anchored ribosome-binding protein
MATQVYLYRRSLPDRLPPSRADKQREFANGVDGLVRHVIGTADSEITRFRAAAYVALTAAHCMVQDGAHNARAAGLAADNWVRRNPWMAVGIGAFAGAIFGATRARR